MSRQSKSQWDFGELFPADTGRAVLSVSELTSQVRKLLEKSVGQVWVTGEVTNLRSQGSGHIYFTLKDAGAQLSCVLFRTEPVSHRELLKDGQKLLLQGEITVYEARGQYQLIVRVVEPQGLGALQIAFEKLKQKLADEGLFAPERKRPLPAFPQRIGLVTSPTGAAIRDVLHVVKRRNSGLEIILAPCRVQGQGAAVEIAEAVKLLNEYSEGGAPRRPESGIQEESGSRKARPAERLDLILVTRGGGSLEDLWAFNEEAVARAIFQSAVPVVSAVGHEIDYTISDFVADVRAATPSVAAEVITEDVYASREFVAEAPALLRRRVLSCLETLSGEAGSLHRRLLRMHPKGRLHQSMQRLDDLQGAMLRCVRQGMRDRGVTARNLASRLSRLRPAYWVHQRRETVGQRGRRLRERAVARLRDLQNRVATVDSRLRLLGPQQVLARGYSITTDRATGKIIRRANDVKPGQKLNSRVMAGEIRSVAEP